MKIPGRARCNCFLVKYMHNAKMEKFNRKQYSNFRKMSRNRKKTDKFTTKALSIRCVKNLHRKKCEAEKNNGD